MNKRTQVGNYIFLLGVFAIYMLNLNLYDMYVSMRSANYILSAFIFTVVFVCYADFKSLIKDKLFIILAVTNLLAAIFIIISGAINTAALTVYIFTICIYLYDKVKFTKKQIIIFASFIGAFFIYWTIDVKGYFKGYSINFGGLVLIAGFVCLTFLLELFKYHTINSNNDKLSFLRKYPYYVTFAEIVLFIVGVKIISYYQSRTGMMALIVLACILVIPKSLLYKKYVSFVCAIGAFLLMLVLPLIYLFIANRGILNDVEIFYRPIIGNRVENWNVLYSLIRSHLIKGNGSIYIVEGSSFREGFLDCCNGVLQISVVYGVVIAVAVFAMLIYVLYRQSLMIKNNPFATSAYLCLLVYIVTSASESFIFNPIFVVAFAGMLYITNSCICGDVEVENTDIYAAYKNMATSEYKKKFIPTFCVS